jgi:hypothetical protein
MRTLRLLNLHCNKTYNDDVNNSQSNEAFLAVENGIFHVFGPKLMMNKSEWVINVDVQFNKQAKISFFDEDLIRNLSTTKNFRNYIIEEKEVHKRSQTINFTGNNANYILTFEII